MTTAQDIFTTIDKVKVGDIVHLRSGATFTVSALSLKTKDYQFSKYEMPHEVWEVEGIDHDSEFISEKVNGEWVKTQRFTNHPFKTTIADDIAIVCIRK